MRIESAIQTSIKEEFFNKIRPYLQHVHGAASVISGSELQFAARPTKVNFGPISSLRMVDQRSKVRHQSRRSCSGLKLHY
jgi:hypothetical protein